LVEALLLVIGGVLYRRRRGRLRASAA
jgi:hypothetical protein